jgi:hypothetical protein
MSYASSLHTVSHADLAVKKAEDAVCVELHSLYRSLLGAVAFLLLMRTDIAVFVSALQRWEHILKIIHVKRLNALIKWIQANARRLVYKPFVSPGDRQVDPGTHLCAFADSTFKTEEQTGHCMQGAVLLLCPEKTEEPFVRTAKCHLLDFVFRQ